MRCALACLADVSRKISVRQPYLGLVFAFDPVHVDGNRFCCSRTNQAIVYTWFLWSSCTFQLILLAKFCKFRNTSIEWFRSAAVDKSVYSQTRERANWISEHLLYDISYIFFMPLSTKCSTSLYRFSFFFQLFFNKQLSFLFFSNEYLFPSVNHFIYCFKTETFHFHVQIDLLTFAYKNALFFFLETKTGFKNSINNIGFGGTWRVVFYRSSWIFLKKLKLKLLYSCVVL